MALYPSSPLPGNSGAVTVTGSSLCYLPVTLPPGGVFDFVSLASPVAMDYSLRIWAAIDIGGSDGGSFYHMKTRAGKITPGMSYPEANAIRLYTNQSPAPQDQASIALISGQSYFINIVNLTNEPVGFTYRMYDTMTGVGIS